MQRQRFRVTLANPDGTIVQGDERSAWNAGIRATEQAVRHVALSEGTAYDGGAPDVSRAGRGRNTAGDVYRRVWTADKGGRVLVATVTVEG